MRHVKNNNNKKKLERQSKPQKETWELWHVQHHGMVLELSDQELKVTMINIPRALTEEVDNMLEQMDHVSKETEILRRNTNACQR